MANRIRFGICTDQIVLSLYMWAAKADQDPWASIDAFQEQIGLYREAGINEFIIDQPADNQVSMLERVVVEVIPNLRGLPAQSR